MKNNIICSNPRIIVNPKLIDVLAKYKHYVFRGTYTRMAVGRRSMITNFVSRWFNPEKHYITENDIDTCYIPNEYGECIPIYMQVPCGHCACCDLNKQYSFVQRCLLETQSHKYYPYFVTLTYNNDNLPLSKELVVSDVQKFIKRLRTNLHRHYDQRYDKPIRYVAVGEYGKKGRPHYHLIIWGIPATCSDDYKNIKCLITDSWKLGFTTLRVVNPAKDDKCFQYTAKYLHKPTDTQHLPHEGARKPFRTSSNRNGGIGKPYLMSQVIGLRKALSPACKILNMWKGKPEELVFNSWTISAVFPSYCRLVPSDVRGAIRYLSVCPSAPCRDRLLDMFRPYQYIYDGHPYNLPPATDKYDNPDDAYYIIQRWMQRFEDAGDFHAYMKDAVYRDKQRGKFLIALMNNPREVSISAREYSAKSMFNRQLSLEQL